MKLLTDRKLTDKQHNSLDRLDKKYDDARVVGWMRPDSLKDGGPVVQCSEGRLFVRPSGYASKLD
jgi:hypothetical protein